MYAKKSLKNLGGKLINWEWEGNLNVEETFILKVF